MRAPYRRWISTRLHDTTFAISSKIVDALCGWTRVLNMDPIDDTPSAVTDMSRVLTAKASPARSSGTPCLAIFAMAGTP
jgi:hypothetical protein